MSDNPKLLVRVLMRDGAIIRTRFHEAESFSWEIEGERPPKALTEWFAAYQAKEPLPFLLPLRLKHLPPFTQKVLRALQKISFGKTLSYGELASKIGSPKGARAVGNACGRNPFPLLIPCHRIVGAGGALGGFSAGPLFKKELLLFEHSS